MLNFRFWRKAAIDISITMDQRILSPAMNRRSNPRYGAHNSSRKSALSALYLAACRRRSEPCITTCPSVVRTHHLQARPRFFKITSKTGN